MRNDHQKTLTKEYWRWRYRDPKFGQVCTTEFELTAQEAAALLEAERIEGSMLLLDVEDDELAETGPEIRLSSPE